MKLVATTIFSLACISATYPQSNSNSIKPATSDEIAWMTWDEAMEANEIGARKLFVYVYTDWDGWGKRLEAVTFSDDKVIQYLNENYHTIKLDGELKEDITFRGRTFRFVDRGRRGYHELPTELMNGKVSYPTLVFLTEELGVLQPLSGFRTVEELLPILEYFGKDHYKHTTWDDFSARWENSKNTSN